MKINVMRGLDYHLGPVLCQLLLLLRPIGRRPRPKAPFPLKGRDLREILVIKFWGMGSILLASPSLRALKKTYPSAKITIVTLLPNLELCRALDHVDRVMGLDVKGPFAFLTSFLGIVRGARRIDLDAVINLEFLTNFSVLVTLLATVFRRREAVKIGFASPYDWRNGVYDFCASFDHSKHITEIFAKTISCLTGGVPNFSLEEEKRCLLGKRDRGYVKALLRERQGLADRGRFVCFSVGASELSHQRRWPREFFVKVANSILKDPDVVVFLIGAREDASYVAGFREMLTPAARVINVCGQTDLRQLLGLFSESQLLVTNDGGCLHLAVTIGLPTVSFFGPETPHLYGPADRGHVVFYQDRFCSPCLSIYNSKLYRCQDNICLKEIKPEDVWDVIEQRWTGSR